MTLLEEIKARLGRATEGCNDLPMTEAIVKARHQALSTVEKFMKEKGLWDKVKNENPGKFVVVSQGNPDPRIITVLISDYLKGLLR